MVFASHIHTGPALESFFESKEEINYKEWLKTQIVNAVKLLNIDNECSIKFIRKSYNDLNSNRRWFMKDGTLLTNPPKGDPNILKPEGPVDRELLLLLIYDSSEKLQVAIANISNHTDTIGGNLISADWPGFMEKRVQNSIDKNIMMIPAIAPAGNINHFDFSDTRSQTSYLEAERIGNTYGDIVLSAIKKSEALNIDKLEIIAKELPIASREVDETEIANAMKNVETASKKVSGLKELTAEDLAKGNKYVKLLFQKELLKYVEKRKENYIFPFQAFFLYNSKNKNSSAIIGIPGEPFVEIGLELKKIKGYKFIMPITLANGYYGYIPLEKHFKHGGYEVLTTPSNCLSEKAGEIIIEEYKKILEWFKDKKQ